MNEDLRRKVLADLEQSGFGAEMMVLKMMADHDWIGVGSDTYRDEDQGVLRDIDASGFIQRWCKHEGSTVAIVLIFLAIEVKRTKTPWVVFRGRSLSRATAYEPSTPLIYAANLPGTLFRFKEAISTKSIVQSNGWIGRGLHEAFKNPSDKSRWYSACVTSCKAAEYIMNREARAEAPRGSISHDLHGAPTYFLLSRPVVVLDGPLIVAELDASGDVLLSETGAAQFDFPFASEHCKENRYIVDLVTLSNFPDYLSTWVHRRNRIAEAIVEYAGLQDVLFED